MKTNSVGFVPQEAVVVVVPESRDRADRECSNEENVIPQVLTIRMLMSGKEVGSIIGRRGDNVKCYREKSGARINISDGSSPERIVAVTGTVSQIFHAFAMMCQKFEDDFKSSLNNCQRQQSEDISCPPVTFRVLIAAIQCGSIIGKGGCKIKEIRELTGASVQVASELLPNSTERSVTISGAAKAVARCIRTICDLLLESPAKGVVIPYKCGNSGNGTPAETSQRGSTSYLASPELANQTPMVPNQQTQAAVMPPLYTPVAMANPLLNRGGGIYSPPFYSWPSSASVGLGGVGMGGDVTVAMLHPSEGMTGYMSPPPVSHGNLYQNGSTSFNMIPTTTPSNQNLVSIELVLPNDLIGCLIGRGGHNIAEIRHTSKALIKISPGAEGSLERRICISGEPSQVATASGLIHQRIITQMSKYPMAVHQLWT